MPAGSGRSPKWRVYYDDATTFDSSMGAPDEAPSEGFLCAIGYDERGRRYIMHGWNFYQWDEETAQWWGMDLFGLLDRLRRNLVYAFKEGRTVPNSVWQETLARAADDPEFPI